MSELVCLQCGREMEYDWAPCPNCGWKVPGAWEEPQEDENEPESNRVILDKPRPWIQWTVWALLAAGLVSWLLWNFR